MELTGHKGPLYSLINFGNGIITAGGDRMIVYWQNLNTNEGNVLAMTSGPVYSLLWQKKENRLLASNDTGGLHVIDLKTQKETRLLKFHTAPVFDMLNSEKSNLLVTSSGDGTLAVADNDEYVIQKQVKISELKVRCLQLMNEEKLLAAGTGDGLIFIFEFPELKLIDKIEAHQAGFSVNTLAFLPGKQILISGGRDAHINIFSSEDSFQKLDCIPGHNYSVYSIAFSLDKKRMATASRDKTIKIWDTENFRVLKRISLPEFLSHTHSVNKLLWREHELISVGDDRKIILWSVA
jgi:WD40 repeat protein